MSERIAELLRQRALLQEHLAWLDREIAAAQKIPNATSDSSAAPPPPAVPAFPARDPIPPSPSAPASAESPAVTSAAAGKQIVALAASATKSAATAPADTSLEKYRVSPDAVKNDVRKGCLLYFALAFVLLIVGVAVLWFIFRR